MLRKLRACSAGITLRNCHDVDAPGGGVLRRSRAFPASAGVLLLLEEIEPAADLPWSEKVGSSKFCLFGDFTAGGSLLAVLVASKQTVVL